MERPETGAMKFGNDYAGVFLRGDSALHASHCLQQYLEHGKSAGPITLAYINQLAALLGSCAEGPDTIIENHLKEYPECILPKKEVKQKELSIADILKHNQDIAKRKEVIDTYHTKAIDALPKPISPCDTCKFDGLYRCEACKENNYEGYNIKNYPYTTK